MLLSGPLHVSINGFVFLDFLQSIKLPAQLFFCKFPVNKGVTLPTDINTSLAHIFYIKVFSKPFIPMTGSRNQMMKCNQMVATTKFTVFSHTWQTSILLVILYQATLRSVCFNGNSRIRLPVAAKIAFRTAGAATETVGSPMPPQKSPDGITIVSTFGISTINIDG